MENLELFRKQEVKRLMDWIKTKPEDWDNACTCLFNKDLDMTKEALVELLADLKRNSFYQILVVLLSIMYIKDWEIRNIINNILYRELTQNWSEQKVGQLTGQVISGLKTCKTD